MTDLRVVQPPARTDPRLGRVAVFDERSRAFALGAAIDRSTWRTRSIRVYDPLPNPNQCHGECTYCSRATQFNAVGNRVPGVVLGMEQAHAGYHLATRLDPFPGVWPPEDTGSSLLAACKAAQSLGHGGAYHFIFGGADEVTQGVVEGRVIVVGTWWTAGMFDRDGDGRIEPTGSMAGGHAYAIRGYDVKRDWLLGRCWWGDFRDFWIKREHLNDLLMDDGDAVFQERVR